MGSQQYCLRWNNHQSSVMSVFSKLLSNESLVDVTLACEGAKLKAHRVVLSACSPYFQEIFEDNPCQHPVVILKDFTFAELRSLIDFIYKGEVNINQQCLDSFLKTAESLKISGLANVSTDDQQTVTQAPSVPPPAPTISRATTRNVRNGRDNTATGSTPSTSNRGSVQSSLSSLCEVTVEETLRPNFCADVIRLEEALHGGGGGSSGGGGSGGDGVTRITSDLESTPPSHPPRLMAKPRVGPRSRVSPHERNISDCTGIVSTPSSSSATVAASDDVMIEEIMQPTANIKEEIELLDEDLEFVDDLDSNFSRTTDNPDTFHSEMSSMDVSRMASTSAWPDGSVAGPSWALPLAPPDHDMLSTEASGSQPRKDNLTTRIKIEPGLQENAIGDHQEQMVQSIDEVNVKRENSTNIVMSKKTKEITLPRLPKAVEEAIANKSELLHRSGKHRYRRLIVESLYDKLRQHTLYPTHEEYNHIASALIKKYPFLKDHRGCGYATWVDSLKNKFKTERRQLVVPDVLAKRKKFGSESRYGQTTKSPRKPSASLIRFERQAKYNSNYLNIEDDSDKCQSHYAFIETEMEKEDPNLSAIKEKMTKSFFDRHERMKHQTVIKSLEMFPWMTDKKLIYHEMMLLSGVSAPTALHTKVNIAYVRIVEYAKTHKRGSELLELLQSCSDQLVEEQEVEVMSKNACIGLLPFIFKEDCSLLYSFKNDAIDAPTPRIVLQDHDNVLEEQIIEIVLDGVAVCKGRMNLVEATAILMSVYYVYCVAYPLPLKGTLEFIQNFFLDLKNTFKLGLKTIRMINLFSENALSL